MGTPRRYTGVQALEIWAQRITQNYNNVTVRNMSESWRNGLAWCAILHHYRPELINYDELDQNDVYGNNQLAFDKFESLGIQSILEAKDMVELSQLDSRSIILYLSSIYRHFEQPNNSPRVATSPGNNSNSSNPLSRFALSSLSP